LDGISQKIPKIVSNIIWGVLDLLVDSLAAGILQIERF